MERKKTTTTTTYPENTTTVCEKLRRVITTTSPFRAIRFVSSNNQVHQETPSSNVSLMTRAPVNDRCARVPRQSTPTTTTPASDRCPRQPLENKREVVDHLVPIIFHQSEDHHVNSSGRPTKPSFLPIHGNEHRVPTMSHIGEKSSIAESINGLFTEYIDRAGRKIRSPTMADGSELRPDSFNEKVTDFISRAKIKFHTTSSLVDYPSKEKRMK